MAYVDFGLLKQQVTIEQVVDMLGLSLKRIGAQLRGACPIHGGGDRALVVTPDKGLFYNFCRECQFGGDMIELVSRVQGLSQRDAAGVIAERFMATAPSAATAKVREASASDDNPASANRRLQPLDYLVVEHTSLASLGIDSATFTHFGAGYAPKGIMRGRLAIPIYCDGTLLAYVGRALSNSQDPTLLYPKDFEPTGVIFNADKIGAGPLAVTDDPLKVLVCHAHGLSNVVALIGIIDADVLQKLCHLMRDRGCDRITLI